MTRIILAALAIVAVLAAIFAHMASQPARPWDEYGDVDAHPLEPGMAMCRECGWTVTHPNPTARMYAYLNHRDADHE